MSHLTYFSYPGFGEEVLEAHHTSQAVRRNNTIEISGQSGWYPSLAGKGGQFNPIDSAAWPPTMASHVDQAFENVEFALKHAGGAGWSQVYKIRVYYLDPAYAGDLARNVMKWCPGHTPNFTAVQVAGLAFPEMLVEVEVVADLGSQ